jgi:hypothetical protein
MEAGPCSGLRAPDGRDELIIRINRGHLPLGSEGELLQRLEVEGRRATRPAGLIAGSIGRRLVEDRVELVAVTYWQDTAALEAAFGPDWAKPAPILGFDIEMSERSIEHLESVVADVGGLFGNQPHGSGEPGG